MKKVCCLLIFVLLLSGCRAEPTFETLQDVYAGQNISVPREVLLDLPEDISVIQNENGKLYLCDGYDITVETFASGDLHQTIQTLTGFAPDSLTLLQTSVTDAQRYECVWSAAGEGGDMVGRAVVLDDGNYHYCVTVMASSDRAGELSDNWQTLLDSFGLH